MNVSQLINEIVSEWAYRVNDGMPDPKNPAHLNELGIVLSEMGLSHIKSDLVKGLLGEAEEGGFKNPALNKKINYKNTKGEDAEGIVGNLLRLPKEHPGRKAAERTLPPEGSEERDALNKDLGGEGQPAGAETPKDDKGKEDGGGAEKEKQQQAQAMFDPKADPAMGARMDKEKEVHAQLAKDAEKDKEAETPKEEPKKEDGFEPIASVDVKSEIPQADPDTFGAGSDIPDGIEQGDLQKFNTDISKVQQMVADAKAKGEPAPNINLCQVTVPGTNLYCDGNLGIPRAEMPQFKGKAQPGSRAADMPVDASGEVDTEPVFREMLKQNNIKVTQTEVPADKLKATQSELVGAKVVGMMGALEKDPEHEKITAPIYVSRDGYVIDGHHRWAAVAAYNAKYPDKQIPMKVQVLDQDIKDAIPMANKFAEDMGIAAKKADANKETPSEKPADAPKKVSSFTKLTDKIKNKISKWQESEKEFFQKGYYKAGSEPRRTLGQAIKDKAKGALTAIKKGAKHEIEEFKTAGKGIGKFFKGEDLDDHEKKALKAVAIKVATTAIFGAAMGGMAHGAAGFAKHVAIEFIPHVVGETILKGAGRAALFADVEGEAQTDANMEKFIEMIAKGIEELDISEEQMEAMVDSYNEKKDKGEIDNTETPQMKEELLPLVDSLIAEIIAGFIQEAKPIKKSNDVLDQTVVNPTTGRDIKVKTALTYKGDPDKGKKQAYRAAFDLLKKKGSTTNKALDKKKPKPSLATDKAVQARVSKEKDTLAKLQKDKQPKQTEPTKPAIKKAGGSLENTLSQFDDSKGKTKVLKDKVNRSVSNITNYLNKEANNKKNPYSKELSAVSGIVKKIFDGSKLSEAEKKMAARWIRTAEPTDANPDTAKFYIALEPNNFKKRVKEETGGKGASNVVFAAFRKHMEDSGITQISSSTFGGKKTTANQTFVDENGKTKLLKLKDGKNIASVQKDRIGKVNSVTIGGLKIVKLDTNEKGISDEEREIRKRNNRNINEYAAKIEAGDMDFIDMDNGVIPDNPKNRVIVIQQSISGMAKRFKDLADKYYIADKDTLGIIQKLEDFSKRDPNKNPEQWYNDLQGMFSEIANHEGEPSLKEGWANFAEVYAAIVEMHDTGRGTQNGKCALLPQSTTLETVDVITIADGTNERKIVTLDGRSVKKGVGGASALTSKCNKSTYKNDKDGKIKEAVIKLSESHSPIYNLGLDVGIKEHTSHHKNYRQDIINRAKGLGVSDSFIKNVQNRLSDPAKCPNPLPKGNTCGAAHQSITEAVKTLIQKRDEKGLPTDEQTMAKIRMRLESYYYYTFLSHESYNQNVDVQDFSNDSILSQKGDAGGSQLVKSKKIHINSSNGTSILAYPKPEFNVGFSLDGRSSNPGAGRFHNEPKRK